MKSAMKGCKHTMSEGFSAFPRCSGQDEVLSHLQQVDFIDVGEKYYAYDEIIYPVMAGYIKKNLSISQQRTC